MSAPTVSVLMPAYNAERHVARAAESILGQTFADLEFLVVDDGSTDRTGVILERLAAADPRLRLTRRPNDGLTSALNLMLGAARGELIARMDADDVAMPDRIGRQVDFLREHPEVVAVGGQVQIIDRDGDPIGSWRMATDHEEIDRHALHTGSPGIVHPALTARRTAMEAVGGYRADREPCEDLDLMLRLAEHGRLANLTETVLRYRRLAESVSHTRSERQHRLRREIVAEACRRRGLDPPSSADREDEAPATVAGLHRRWAWWALQAGHMAPARKHALLALRREPWSPASWTVFACCLRGR